MAFQGDAERAVCVCVGVGRAPENWAIYLKAIRRQPLCAHAEPSMQSCTALGCIGMGCSHHMNELQLHSAVQAIRSKQQHDDAI